MKNKITKSINIELAKAKIILFSDRGFDLVLKLKNFVLINDKRNFKEESDPEFEQCDNVRVFVNNQHIVHQNRLSELVLL